MIYKQEENNGKIVEKGLGYRNKREYSMSLFLSIFLILLINNVEAEFNDDGSCVRNTDCNLVKLVINETSADPIPNANCTLDIINPNGTQLVNATTGNPQMINSTAGDGRYNYTINFNQLGTYPTFMSCNDTFGDSMIDKADLTFIIGTPTNFRSVLHILLTIIPLGLFWFARRYGFHILIMLSGIMLATFGVGLYANSFPFLSFETSLSHQALAITILAVGLYIVGRTAIELSAEARIEG